MVQCLDGVRQLLAVLLNCCDVELKQPRGLQDPQVLARETVCKPNPLSSLLLHLARTGE
jgi:serine/threonine-protein phosphatase 2B regulatory subunit